MKDLMIEDELVNDYEFAQRIYQNGLPENLSIYYNEKNLIWADML